MELFWSSLAIGCLFAAVYSAFKLLQAAKLVEWLAGNVRELEPDGARLDAVNGAKETPKNIELHLFSCGR